MRRQRQEIEATQKLLTRRTAVLGGLQLAFVGGLAARMHQLQLDQGQDYRLLAEENRINIQLIAPERGEVFDREGVALASNVPSYRIVFVRENAGDVDLVFNRLRELVELDEDMVQDALKDSKAAPFHKVTVAENVSWEVVSRVSVNAPALPGIQPEVGLTRYYPRGSDFAHVLGYVGPISDFDLSKIENPDQLLSIPRFQFGKSGIESNLEDNLRGQAGTKQVEVNASGRVMRELSRVEGISGTDLQLTLDSNLQNYVQARLGEESASAVVMDVETGDILAMTSAPTYDPNLFVQGISSRNYNALLHDDHRPLVPKAIQGSYPPGSTFKMITALAALEEGMIGPEDTVWCPGYTEIAGRRVHCWKRAGHGHVNLKMSLEQSCDIFYYDLAAKVGIERISDMARRFGLGVQHDIPVPSVSKGLMPTKDWKFQTHKEDWMVGDTVNATIGQGFLLASPLQLTVMTSRLATGREIKPRLVKSIDGRDTYDGPAPSLGVSEANLSKIRNGMYAVVNSRKGTAYRSRVIDDGARIAGKTGTSQVFSITAAERASGVRKCADLPWNRRDHALFVNFAPYDNPKIAVTVVVEHGCGGSSAAAPIARDITLQALYKGAPPLEAYPQRYRDGIAEQQERLKDVQPMVQGVGTHGGKV